jgi:hypothetical protein
MLATGPEASIAGSGLAAAAAGTATPGPVSQDIGSFQLMLAPLPSQSLLATQVQPSDLAAADAGCMTQQQQPSMFGAGADSCSSAFRCANTWHVLLAQHCSCHGQHWTHGSATARHTQPTPTSSFPASPQLAEAVPTSNAVSTARHTPSTSTSGSNMQHSRDSHRQQERGSLCAVPHWCTTQRSCAWHAWRICGHN